MIKVSLDKGGAAADIPNGRRKFISIGLMGGAAVALAGCNAVTKSTTTDTTGTTTNVTTWNFATLSTDIQLIDGGLQAVVASVDSAPNIAADVKAKLDAAAATIHKDAQLVAQSLGVEAPASTVADIANTLTNVALAVLPVLAPIPGAAAIVAAIKAAQALVPVILAAVQVPVKASVAADGSAYTPAQARAVLAKARTFGVVAP